ncbi:unnamed protein product [Didymodactylos carnosus]|uniref:Uncharacterized protein n=1 Tax=Didymodactylos carnosus TaxID=1234261 RepID=A0A816A662_9BILA|nr:unnamed protein product [Didymodactylos carnosus]CAF1591659.1 unnamed protein product [Didymodactylos carnosus]CAF4038405.1 unnamed protein product [Didymodactylos carnosus]CAF4464142.1 unnamed protein product [Didymodactylos carnosus]
MSLYQDDSILKELMDIISLDHVKNYIEVRTDSIQKQLNSCPTETEWLCETIPAETFQSIIKSAADLTMPTEIRLIRLFILRRNTQFKYENHVNSYQRLYSLRNNGKMFVKLDNKHQWESTAVNMGQWHCVSPNTWHYPYSNTDNDWITLTFHTQSSEDIIDRYDYEKN